MSPAPSLRFWPELHTFAFKIRAWQRIKSGGNDPRLLVDVKNTAASRRQVVQMYIRDCVSSVTRPVKELKGFQNFVATGRDSDCCARHHTGVAPFYDLHMKMRCGTG